MTPSQPIRILFLDIGGVLLTNGWDRHARRRAAEHFDLDHDAFDERHRLAFDAYETGGLTLDEYLRRTVFHEPRTFTPAAFREFMFSQSRPLPEMLEMFRRIKTRHRLRTAAVSNEGRELTEYRVSRFDLGSLIDFFISSCFVHVRKPDAAIYRMALDVAQVPPGQAAYVDDRAPLVEVARSLGIRGIHHEDAAATRDRLAGLGLDPGS